MLHDFPKLHLDEHISPRIALQLRKYGFDVTSSQEKKMLSKNDNEQMENAVSEQRAIVTSNFSDYIALDEEYHSAGKNHWGIILTTEEPSGLLLKRLLRLLNSFTVSELKNQIRWLNEFR